jgi:hypothetical protein
LYEFRLGAPKKPTLVHARVGLVELQLIGMDIIDLVQIFVLWTFTRRIVVLDWTQTPVPMLSNVIGWRILRVIIRIMLAIIVFVGHAASTSL